MKDIAMVAGPRRSPGATDERIETWERLQWVSVCRSLASGTLPEGGLARVAAVGALLRYPGPRKCDREDSHAREVRRLCGVPAAVDAVDTSRREAVTTPDACRLLLLAHAERAEGQRARVFLGKDWA